MRLYLVRHGETIWNLESRFQGWSDTPLSPTGEDQAADLRERLRAIPFDAVYSSTLQRARRTAEIIVEGRGLDVIPLPEFREQNLGDMEGLQEDEIRSRFPGQLDSMHADPQNWCAPGGESLGMVRARALPAVRRIAEKHQGETVLLVAHHSVNKVMLLDLLGAPLSSFRIIRQPPCTVSIVELRENYTWVHALNLNWRERMSPWHDLEGRLKEGILGARAIVFDMDGVLLDSMPTYAAAWRGALAERGILPPEIEFFRRESERGPESIKHFYRAAGMAEPDEAEIDSVLARVVELYYRYPTVRVMPGALEFVARARARGIRTAIVTGSPKKHIFQRLDERQRGLFDVLVGADDVPRGKPFPDPYLHAVKLFGLPPEQLFVIENSPFGIASAKAAGLLTIGLTSTLPREDLMAADLVVDSLPRLAGWLGI